MGKRLINAVDEESDELESETLRNEFERFVTEGLDAELLAYIKANKDKFLRIVQIGTEAFEVADDLEQGIVSRTDAVNWLFDRTDYKENNEQ